MIRGLRPVWRATHRLAMGVLVGLRVCSITVAGTAEDECRFFFDAWPAADELEINSVTSILQARDGYLWLGTYNGLMRFDGVRFKVFGSSNSRELPNSRITALFEDAAGVLWIGHETGELSQHRHGRFEAVKPGFDWPGGPVEAISADEDGDLWLGSAFGGLFRLRDGKESLRHLPDKGWPIQVSRDATGRLWLVSNGTTGHLVRGVFQPLVLDKTTHDPHNYERVLPARGSGWWVIRNGEIGKWAEGRWQWPLQSVPWKQDFATSLLETSSGELLVGTMRNGLYLLAEAQPPRRFTRADGLSSDRVRCLHADREGNVWLGTGKGLNALRTKKVRMLNPPDQWGGHTVLSFSLRSDGSAWIGTQGAGLYRYDPHSLEAPWRTFTESNGLQSPFIWSVLETRRGDLLAGSWGNGVAVLRHGRFKTPHEFARLPGAVMAMYESADGELWFGTRYGLLRSTGGAPDWIAGRAELGVPDVRAITESPDGTLWFGMSGGGLASWKNGSLKQFGKADGLGSDFVQCLHASPDDTLWIGTADNGLTRLKRGCFATISLAEGLPNATITQIVDDRKGHLWLGSHRGIFRVSTMDLNRCADGDVRAVRCLSYGRAEGLTSQTCSGGFQPGARLAADGKLWFPTAKGVAIIDPAKVTTNVVVPPVVIEEFRVDGHAVPAPPWTGAELAAARRIVPAGKHRFEFHYTGLSFVAPDRVRFRHRLEGLEEDWIESGSRREVQYTHLPPGAYAFRVLACNNDSVWNTTGASLAFTVLPHFWQTWWFKAAAVLAGAGAVGGGILSVMRQRVRQKLARMAQQQAIERERTRIARDIHDDLGASLTRITMLSQTMRKELASGSPGAQAAHQVQSTARELTRAMDEIVWAINPRHDTLDSLATYLGGFAQDFLEPANIRCRLDVPMHLPSCALTAEVRHNVFLALKEALHNVVKHSGATEVEVALKVTPAGFSLIVTDNGCGLPGMPAPADASEGPAEPARRIGGNGTANMKRRLEQVGGRCEIEAAPIRGTQVRFTLPYQTGPAVAFPSDAENMNPPPGRRH